MLTNKQQETLIMMALFVSTVEQSTHLTNEYQHKLKADFNLWQKQGFKILEHWEREIPEFKELIQPLVDVIHTSFSEAKQNTD